MGWGILGSLQPGPLPAPQAVSRGAADPAGMAAAAPISICFPKRQHHGPRGAGVSRPLSLRVGEPTLLAALLGDGGWREREREPPSLLVRPS